MDNRHSAILVLSLLLTVACGKREATTYQVAKETAPPSSDSSMGSPEDMQAVQAAHAAMAAQMPGQPAFTIELPPGWKEVPGAGMRMISYAIEGTAIDFYVLSLAMGDLPSNVNRWRGQVGLAPASPEEIEQTAETLDIGGHPARYIEIYNEAGGKGIIAAIVPAGTQYWYFTAKGMVDELKARAGEIRSFLKALKTN